jgi:hypothetical protein
MGGYSEHEDVPFENFHHFFVELVAHGIWLGADVNENELKF